MGRLIPHKIKKAVLERDENNCQRCGNKSYLEIHHIFPVHKGGKTEESNLITLCGVCHDSAPDTAYEFFIFLKRHRLPANMDSAINMAKLMFKFFVQMDEVWFRKIKEEPEKHWRFIVTLIEIMHRQWSEIPIQERREFSKMWNDSEFSPDHPDFFKDINLDGDSARRT